jgi:hypothetical protein
VWQLVEQDFKDYPSNSLDRKNYSPELGGDYQAPWTQQTVGISLKTAKFFGYFGVVG